MGDRHDYVALEWVKGEIAETLKQARQALESYVENPQDPTRMGFCLAYIHQVRGTLQMVEFYGAALLAEEMEYLTQALIDGKVSSQSEALEVLMQAILQLPAYLERIQSARRDLPLVVLPLLNDLRTARGEKLLSETSLFSPDLSQSSPVLPVDALARLRTAELPALLRKLRQMLQVALVGVIRNQDLPTNLGYLARVFARLESLCKDAPLGRLWVIASAMIEGLANGSIANGTSVRNLLRQVDREFKRLVDQGADAMNQAAPEELIKNLLFYVAKASDQSPRVRAVKDEYRLDDALPGAALVDEERARLAGPDRDAMRSVVGALCEELVRVKDSLDLFVRSDRSGVNELGSLLAPLKQIADTLAVLGFGQPRKVILDQIEVVSALAHGQRQPNDATLMDVAGALLYVEATLAGMVGPSEEPGSEENVLPTTDVEQIHQVVIKEARNGLELAKDAIIEFIASQWNHEHLARVPELLTQVRGGLAMISQERAAKLLENCNRYIQEQLLVRQAVPDWHSLDTLADAITSVEYYLERLSEDHNTQGDMILDVAEESLDSLGYSLKPRPSILDVEPTFLRPWTTRSTRSTYWPHSRWPSRAKRSRWKTSPSWPRRWKSPTASSPRASISPRPKSWLRWTNRSWTLPTSIHPNLLRTVKRASPSNRWSPLSSLSPGSNPHCRPTSTSRPNSKPSLLAKPKRASPSNPWSWAPACPLPSPAPNRAPGLSTRPRRWLPRLNCPVRPWSRKASAGISNWSRPHRSPTPPWPMKAGRWTTATGPTASSSLSKRWKRRPRNRWPTS